MVYFHYNPLIDESNSIASKCVLLFCGVLGHKQYLSLCFLYDSVKTSHVMYVTCLESISALSNVLTDKAPL